ncbi:MAG: hypothetical protein PVI13_03390 [Desulfobacterales bacterium]
MEKLSFCDDPALVYPRQAAVWHVAVVGPHNFADSCCGLVIAGIVWLKVVMQKWRPV